MHKRASILIGLLWCLALLSVVVIGLLHTARLDLIVVKNHGDRIQAHYIALAGVEKTKALLYHDMLNRRGVSRNHTGLLYDDPKEFREVDFGRGKFRVIHRDPDSGEMIYGITDEESRLNVNVATPENFTKIKGMTPDIVAAIIDWRDGNNEVTPSGAEADYYASLQPPYLPRNGPFQTKRELLMVRGITRELLLGDDFEQNGLLDSDGDDDNSPGKNRKALRDPGWASLFTVDSTVENHNAAGKNRVDIKSADEGSLTSIKGISSQIAKAIIANRNQNQFESIADLLDVVEIQNQPGQSPAPPNRPNPTRGQSTRSSRPTSSGPRVISDELFMDIADDVAVDTETRYPGLININTASLDVLTCLTGIEPELAQAIISHRKSDGYFANVGWLLKVPGMTREIFKQVAPRITARSDTFRIISEGKVTSTGARQRIEAIVHIERYTIETLSYREDL
ncbi:MAG: helix-hairpin-helix domain-containing protein [Verrucomicrobiota bacterium]